MGFTLIPLLYMPMYFLFCLFNFRGKKTRVFVFGDYEFLCALYGITGANGMYIL